MTAACQICKYPREGLGDDIPCPECGRSLSDILPPLADEPAQHRRRVTAGARLACVSIGVRLAHAVVLTLEAIFAGNLFWPILWIGLALVAAINAAAAFLITRRGNSPGRPWLRTTLRSLCIADLVIALIGGAILLADHTLWLAWIVVGVLSATWIARCMVMVGVIGTLASRLRSEGLIAQLRGWLKYAGIAAMAPVVAVVAAALTALIPILAPFTIIFAIPFTVFVAVLSVIAVAGSVLLHAKLARELRATS